MVPCAHGHVPLHASLNRPDGPCENLRLGKVVVGVPFPASIVTYGTRATDTEIALNVIKAQARRARARRVGEEKRLHWHHQRRCGLFAIRHSLGAARQPDSQTARQPDSPTARQAGRQRTVLSGG